jgi:sterol 3beta-glucosyltransferase
MGGSLTKATLVDVPNALADGLHAVPSLYGEKGRDHGAVTDWKSGGAAAGKVTVTLLPFSCLDIWLTTLLTFGYGFYDGITGIVTQPIKGAKEGGTLGFAKGLAKGTVGLVTKTGAGMSLRFELCYKSAGNLLWMAKISTNFCARNVWSDGISGNGSV